MQTMYYIGLDVHKRTICYCVKDASGAIHSEGKFVAIFCKWADSLKEYSHGAEIRTFNISKSSHCSQRRSV